MLNPRMERITQQIQQEIALILQREVKDPHIGFVTITGVSVTRDLAYARVAYSTLGPEAERERSQLALERSAPYIRELLKKRLRTKVTPELQFKYDPSIAHSVEMQNTFDRIREQDKPRADDL